MTRWGFRNHTGHFVQYWLPAGFDERVEYVQIGSRAPQDSGKRGNRRGWDLNFRIPRTGWPSGWRNLRREGLSGREAVALAKEVQRAGFDSRVVLRTNSGEKVLHFFQKKG